MTIKNGKINPLNALALRKVNFPAAHFHFITLNKFNPNYLRQIDDWIFNSLNGRYYIGSSLALINNSITYVTKIGFETDKEISFFTIACPHLP